ncbi:MAG: hypothetical protein KDC32_28465 [Saprospiraceae bacterium]|nr:hypothetical protein [Anaerolineales bacterium]MCB0684821.1 hypothetical protein [Saprospiraceae bacterium]MCB8918111.1 hypothetical protein [Ardenticatenaceae bacterium]
MPKQKTIPDEIRQEIIARVDAFNQANAQPQPQLLTPPGCLVAFMKPLGMVPKPPPDPPVGSYLPRFRGAYLYLDRIGWNGRPSEICRLKWTGDINQWEFAIYRHSRNFYDPDEWFFPGAEEVDGSVEGAMRAGLKAYPV